ncbi:MAG TPA: hypothetical protein VH041_13530 [Caldimonas sp.]|jgi:hypothetical protein|nr:hypothetical protein [Caldimonas sp.]HEX4235311.1 hypothetical protein [Caldimonas sp.]
MDMVVFSFELVWALTAGSPAINALAALAASKTRRGLDESVVMSIAVFVALDAKSDVEQREVEAVALS